MTALKANGDLYGRLGGSLRVADLVLSETTYEPAAVVPEHVHTDACLCLVLAGGFQERAGRRATTCDEGTVLYHPRHEPHAHRFVAAPSRCFTIQLGATWTAGRIAPPPSPVERRRDRVVCLTTMLYREFRRTGEGSALAMEGLALGALAALTAATGTRPRRGALGTRLEVVRELAAGHCLEPLRLTELAEVAGVHPAHLARAFRERYGCSLSEFVQRRRLDLACERMRATDESLAAVAAAMGFADQGHFTRRFKARLGVTPGEWRRRAKAR